MANINPQSTSLAIILGPYRNLTTLTASALAFHPNVQVLNHAAEHVLSDPEVDFISNPDDAVFAKFIECAIRASRNLNRGDIGGSITVSHAFDDPSVRSLYHDRFGDSLIKTVCRCLVWKDSMRLQTRFQSDLPQLDRMCSRLGEIRFILPVRHVLDCALSNYQRESKKTLLGLPPNATAESVLEAVILAHAWVFSLRDRYPDRVAVFFQDENLNSVGALLESFLQLPPSTQWHSDLKVILRPRPGYRHEPGFVDLGRSLVARHLALWPIERDRILASL